jgi:hypothetical protein
MPKPAVVTTPATDRLEAMSASLDPFASVTAAASPPIKPVAGASAIIGKRA